MEEKLIMINDIEILEGLIYIQLAGMYYNSKDERVKKIALETAYTMFWLDIDEYREIFYENLFVIGVNDKEYTIIASMLNAWIVSWIKSHRITIGNNIGTLDGDILDAKMPKGVTDEMVEDFIEKINKIEIVE